MSIDRSSQIITAYLSAFASRGRSIRDSDPLDAFRLLAQRIPGLSRAELATAADAAKAIASEIRALDHRLSQAVKHPQED